MGVKVREKKKGSGVWWIFMDHQGQRKAKKIGKRSTAEEVARKVEAKLVLGDLGIMEPTQEPTPTFNEYADLWQETVLPATCKPSTVSDYTYQLRKHIRPVFGKRQVDTITRMQVKTFLMGKTKAGLATSTVTHMKNVLGGVFTLALDDGRIHDNPAHRLGKRVLQDQERRMKADPLTRDELSLLLATFHEHFPRDHPIVLTLARTGMRRGEALALQWGDIDFNGGFITVERTFSRGKVSTPKSGKARRVDMSKQLAETLKQLRTYRKVETLKNGWGEVPEWVFINEDGRRINGTSWKRRVFNKALEKAGLRQIRIHDLRHSYATAMIQAGVSLAYIRDQLGHHSIKLTVDTYGHLVPGANRAAVDVLDDGPLQIVSEA